ncbi:protein mono-ADP-ribosyltransferase PARP14 [Latimeria chalumnae]|uniref:protein mono-ADP-ribosyltransferase PARP14 n=1 Tax=Latimeria chalumnae TaxID=7897 RepID=UPI00313E875F
MAGPYLYPLVVEGDWNPEQAKTLKNKLHVYFQKKKLSGGGECTVEHEDPSKNRAIVSFREEGGKWFSFQRCCETYRNSNQLDQGLIAIAWFYDRITNPTPKRVLEKKEHELVLQQQKVHLTVRLPDTPADTPADTNVLTEQPKSLSANWNATTQPQEEVESKPAQKTGSEQQRTILVLVSKDNLETSHLEMYFENKKRSGGGLIQSTHRDGDLVKITFEKAEDAQEVVGMKEHLLNGVSLVVKSYEDQHQLESQTSKVVLKNLQDNANQELLSMLIENVTGLYEDEGDFSVEMVHEANSAVITFHCKFGICEFIEKWSRHSRVKEQRITARPLEVTKSIRVDNLPSNISEDFILVYFESPKNGGGTVEDAELSPEDNSAVVTFEDPEVVINVMKKKHTISKTSVHIYPYYKSLGTVLYGDKRPVFKMPAPFVMSVNPYVWAFLKGDSPSMQTINNHMSGFFCELVWPQSGSENPDVKIIPSSALLKQRATVANLEKKWKEEAIKAFDQITSDFKVVEFSASMSEWDTFQQELASFPNDGISIVSDLSKEKVVIAGRSETVQGLQDRFRETLECAKEKNNRERSSVTELVKVSPARYAILQNDGLPEKMLGRFPHMKMTYDTTVKCLTLLGLRSEVYSAKSEILEKVMEMKQKQIEVDGFLRRFLREGDTEAISNRLFITNGISALCQLQNNTVELIGDSDTSLVKAETLIKKALDFRFIEVEDGKVLKKLEWKDLMRNLEKMYNSDQKSVLVEEVILDNCEQILLAGYSDLVMEAYEQLFDFINKNTFIKTAIPVKSRAIMTFIKSKKQLWSEVEKSNITFEFDEQSRKISIVLRGAKADTPQAVTLIKNTLSSLHFEILNIDKPGAKKYFQEKEDLFVDSVMHKFNCMLRLQGDDDYVEDDWEMVGDGDGGRDGDGSRLQCQVILPDGTVIAVYKEDLCHHQVDVVVNASNEELQHYGGLAGALRKAAGPVLQKQCDDVVSRRGRLKAGQVAITDAGKLSCKKVIHAVGPRWQAFPPQEAMGLLNKAVLNSLTLAGSNKHQSIAIPAISSGIFGFPLDSCADIIVRSVREYWENTFGTSTLKRIHLVNLDKETVRATASAVKRVFNDHLSQDSQGPKKPRLEIQHGGWSLPVRYPAAMPEKKESRGFHRGTVNKGTEILHQTQTKEGLTIMVNKGSIEEARTNAVVNSVAKDLNLNAGAVSKAVLQNAGPELQELLKEEAQGKPVGVGSVFITKGCNLDCDYVLHVLSPAWQQGKPSAEKALKDVIRQCLEETEALQLNSVTFPAIGTGNLSFPKPLVAALMLDEALRFSRKNNPTYLREVHFTLHPGDGQSIQAFSDAYKQRFSIQPTKNKDKSSSGDASGSKGTASFFSKVSTSASGGNEVQMGSVVLQVASGDITKESTDVIVSSSNNNFTLKAGVSKAILEAAGNAVELECQQLGAQANQEYVITQSGNLQCKKIIHVAGVTDLNQIQVVVGKIIQECEQSGFSSVAFPALGTGQGGVSPSSVADAMINAVADFARQNSNPTLKKVKIVIFQAQMLTEFYNCMQKKEDGNLPEEEPFWKKLLYSVFSKPKHSKKGTGNEDFLIMKNKIEPAILQICGECRESVENTKEWIQEIILKEQYTEKIQSEWILSFDKADHQKISELQEELQVAIKLEYTQTCPVIEICGLTRDVLAASKEIMTMIDTAKDHSAARQRAELFSGLVEWQFEKGNSFMPFDCMANLKLEEAYDQKKKSILISIQNENFTVNFDTMVATGDRRHTMKIKRVSKAEERRVVPQSLSSSHKAELIDSGRGERSLSSSHEAELIESGRGESSLSSSHEAELIESGRGVPQPLSSSHEAELIESGRGERSLSSSHEAELIESGRGERSLSSSHEAELIESGRGVPQPLSSSDQKYDIPDFWDDQKSQEYMSVLLTPTSKEYKEVETLFKISCANFKIDQIERIQNPALWMNYQIKKKSMDTKNGNTKNEKRLFHGTRLDSINLINKDGFNRSYAGMNAAVWGNGSYFAMNASYSAHDTYSPADTSGLKHVYLSRVLTGLHCVGSGGLKAPPPKSTNDPTDMYDSVTDNGQTMYVIFNDIQAYPEYHIAFRR